MSKTWTEAELQKHIDNEIQESLNLDYKSADALEQTDSKKREITKDVSAMANSAGGVIIYGIQEYKQPDKKHLPEKIDPINQTKFSKEWLEQVINNIQPRINGVIINPIPLISGTNDVVYVVEIPQGTTAHQARDNRYYKRYNFESITMEHHEIIDVMGRSKYPIIDLSFIVDVRKISFVPTRKVRLLIKAKNVGQVYAQYVNCRVYLPKSLAYHKISIFGSDDITIGEQKYYKLDNKNTRRDTLRMDENTITKGISWFDPILPSGEHIWEWELPRDFRPENLNNSEKILWEVFADNAPKRSGGIQVDEIEYLTQDEHPYRVYKAAPAKDRFLILILIVLLAAISIYFIWLFGFKS